MSLEARIADDVSHWFGLRAIWKQHRVHTSFSVTLNIGIGTVITENNKKASIRWQDSAPPISGYWPTSEPNAG